MQQRMLGALLHCVSTREHGKVLPKMAETVGVSRSSVSRQAIEASAEQLKALCEKRLDALEILVIYIDGQRFGAHHILSAVQGLPSDRKYLLVIDGTKALRAGIKEVFGDEQPVERCRNHKLRNVLEQQSQTLNLIRAAWKVATPKKAKSAWTNWPASRSPIIESAARSLREGMRSSHCNT